MKTKNTYAKVIILCTAVITFFGVGIFANSLSTWTPTAYTSLGVSLTLFSVYYTFQNGTMAISQIFVADSSTRSSSVPSSWPPSRCPARHWR